MLDARRYRLRELIRSGGMAEVFRAVVIGEQGFERDVAVKRLHPHLWVEPDRVQSFLDEAKLASQLHHANIVSILDFGMMDQAPFQALEFVDGVDAAKLIEAAQGRLAPAPALYITTEVAHALEYAHSARDAAGNWMRIVHRDVSPDNILISWAGDVKLADFGVAKANLGRPETDLGLVRGKDAYMAPEQARGDPCDGRADTFALGCVLHALLVGHSPLADKAVQLRFLAGAEFEIDESLDPELASIIRRATSLSTSDRFASASDMARACGAAFAKRAERDGRSMLLDQLSSLDREAGEEKARSPLSQLLNLELVLGQNDSADENFRQYRTMVKSIPEVQADALDSPTPLLSKLSAAKSEDTTAERADQLEPGEFDGTAPPESLEGVVVHSYRLLELLGRGGSSRVYLAEHVSLKRRYAIKILPPSPTETMIKRLRREAEMLSEIDHPNIVPVIDFAVAKGVGPFLVLEYVEGRTLLEEIISIGPLGPERTASIMSEIASALEAAHRTGVIHRDLKPGNVIIEQDTGIAKLFDFGIARIARADAPRTQLTRFSQLLGTPNYIAPEQIRRPREATEAADLYALGALSYRMLSGRPVFSGSKDEVIQAHLTQAPPPLGDFGGLELVIEMLLQKNPDDRPQSAAAVVELIDAYLRDPSPTTPLATKMIHPTLELPPRPTVEITPRKNTQVDSWAATVPSEAVFVREASPKKWRWFALGAVLVAACIVGYFAGDVLRASRRAEPIGRPPPKPTISARPATSVLPRTVSAELEESSPAATMTPPAPGRRRKRPVRTSRGSESAGSLSPRARVLRELKSRHLRIEDLPTAKRKAWKRALASSSRTKVAGAADRVIDDIRTLPIDADLLRRKLRRCVALMRRIKDPSARKGLEALDDELLSLRSRVQNGESPTMLLPLVNALEGRVRKLRGR